MLKRYRALLACLTVIVIIAACSKGKLETKPSIEIKDVNATALPNSEDFLITINYKDKEGDLGGGMLTYYRNRQNFLPPTNPLEQVVDYPIPAFPKATEGELQLRINAGRLDERPRGDDSIGINNDTVIFKIIVKDVAGNVSDTIETPKLVQLF